MRMQSILFSLILSVPALFGADPALLNLVMPEARVVAGIDVERARDSFLGRKIIAEMDPAKSADFGKFLTATGFDPRRDLREILFAASDAKVTGKNSPGLVLLRGSFDVSRINGFLTTTTGVTSELVGGVSLYAKTGTKEDTGFALLDSSLAIAGHKNMVRAALLRRSANGAALGGDTYAKAQTMSRANDIWLVTSMPVSELSTAIPGGKDAAPGMMNGEAFKGIEQAAMGIRFATEVMELTAETLSRTEKDATGIADVVRFLSTMVQMQREKPEVKALATALDQMKLTTDARTTKLSISLPVAEMEKLMNQPKKAAAPKKI